MIDNYVGGRGLISEKETNGSTVSNIFVESATIQDTGNYTCEAPALASNASVNLHVLVDGKNWYNFMRTSGFFS
jgi:enterochelin esterase-like enzyme